MPTYALGKDTQVYVNSNALAGVRNVSVSVDANEREITPFGGSLVTYLPIQYAVSIDIEVINTSTASTLLGYLSQTPPTRLTVAVGSYSGLFIVSSVSDSYPLDGVASHTFKLKKWGYTS
jgi:hypothetical protein